MSTRRILVEFIALVSLPALFVGTLFARLRQRRVDIGLGPEPLINNIYHKKALQWYGYTVETFVCQVYYITDQFDVRFDREFSSDGKFRFILPYTFWKYIFAYFYSIIRYRCVYFYFNGGPLGLLSRLLGRLEPYLYHLAGVKVVMMPYGGDVQDLSRSPNLLYKHALAHDYPDHRFRRSKIAASIDTWTRGADHIISGCEWVDYMYHWDTLMLGHFSIDTDQWKPPPDVQTNPRPIRILHAPNHKMIKGTQFFIDAVNDLCAEGLSVELVILERVPNARVQEVMASVDIVADQLVIGWYAMFALEAMAMGKPVLCYLRPDLEDLYLAAGLIKPNEIPILNCTPLTVKETMRRLVIDREFRQDAGRRSRIFVLDHHSIQVVGKVFDSINRSINILPSSK